MSAFKGTPGPWVAIQNPEWPSAKYGITPDPSEDWVAAVNSGVASVNGEANARLISAAPELLEALTEIVAAADGDGWKQLDPSFAAARAAIAKATGETP